MDHRWQWIRLCLFLKGVVSDLLFALTQQGSGHFEPPLAFKSLRFMRPLRTPRLPLAGYWGPAREPAVNSQHRTQERGDALKEAGGSVKPSGLKVPFQRKQSAKKQHDVCHRNGYRRVPTGAAAQLGLHVFTRQSGGCLRCAQNRVGPLSPGRERLQAQRSWSELQLSHQVLPSEEWGTVPRCHTHAG